MVAMMIVAISNTPKLPESLAALICAPRPSVVMVCSLRWKYSAMMEAFHAPPDAVTSPVTR